MALTQHKNFADAVDPQDSTPLHQVQAIASAAAAGAVATTGHASESVLVSIAGTVSDLPLGPSTVLGRGPTGDVVAVPFSTIGGITALTGDVSGTGPGSTATTIAAGAVTNAKRANMAASTLSGNATGSPAAPTDLTAAAVKTLLAISFANVTGTLQAAQFPGLTGDVTTSSFVATIAAKAVTFAKMQDIATQALIGRQTAGTGSPESIGVTGGIEFDGAGNIRRSALTGDVVASAGSAGTVISNNAVTNGQLAQVPTGTVKGRTAAGTGNASDLTFAALKTALAISLTTDVIGILQAAQFPALTGDVITTAGSLVTTLANIPNNTPMVGSLLATAIVAPGTPAAGKAELYVDSTNKVWSSKNDAGVVSHTVRSKAAVASQFLTSIGDDGTPGSAQPSYNDLAAGIAQPWATFQFVWDQLSSSFATGQDRWLSSYVPADGGTVDRRFAFYGAGKASTIQSLQVCLNASQTVGTATGLVTFTLQVNGVDTSLSATAVLAHAPGTSVPAVTGNSITLTIPDGSMIGIRMSESAVGGTVSSAEYNAFVTLILR